MGKTHELKTWPEPFKAVEYGYKGFEYRKDDRGFEVGDDLILREYTQENGEYTGQAIRMRVTYILRGSFGVPDGYCVMSIGYIGREDRR